MKAYTEQNLQEFFATVADDYDVFVPVRLPDGTRALGRPGDGALSLDGGPLPCKLASVFFPQLEAILALYQSPLPMQTPAAKPLFVVGWTAADLDGLEFTDKFFDAPYRDTAYFDKRAGAVIVGVSGRCGEEGAFQKIAGGKCDLELICVGPGYIVRPYSDTGRELAGRLPQGEDVEDAVLEALLAESDRLPRDDQQTLERASRLLLEDKVPASFWEKIADRCIACTACNLACPTCTCFDVFDRATTNDGLRRWRLWDSCQLDGFAREASGYNPMGEPRVRTCRRIHHKLAADVVRWGHITCCLCGRCDRVCPAGIGMTAVCRQMVQEYGKP